MNQLAKLNRITWIMFFLTGFIYFAIVEWAEESPYEIGWFLMTGLWSAFCGIGFTVIDWFIQFRD